MTRHGYYTSLLDPLHAEGCDGQEFSRVVPVPTDQGFTVLYAEWCGECGAADYEPI